MLMRELKFPERKLIVVLIKDQSICDGRDSREFDFDIFFSKIDRCLIFTIGYN